MKKKAVLDSKGKTLLNSKIPVKNISPENDMYAPFFQMMPENKEFMFKFLELFPIPAEVFAPDGISVFANRALLELNNVPDAGLIIGKYNVIKDPALNAIPIVRDGIQKAFRGEPAVAYDMVAPIQDLINRGLIAEKPFEKSFMDFYLYPIMKGKELVFVVFVCIVKKLYYGRPDLARAKEYLDTHWQEDFIPEELAKHVNMSVTPLYKLFKEHTGMTPGDYHKKVKIEHLKEKLTDKNLSIKQAFAECGEDSRGWILKTFKKATGMTPTEFRNTQP